jgi:hypothetical protein
MRIVEMPVSHPYPLMNLFDFSNGKRHILHTFKPTLKPLFVHELYPAKSCTVELQIFSANISNAYYS